MKIVEIEFNSAGFREILTSGETQSLIAGATDSLASQVSGTGEFRHGVFLGGPAGRWVGYVAADDDEALKAESEDKVLSRLV